MGYTKTFLTFFLIAYIAAGVYGCKDAGMTCATNIQCCSDKCSNRKCLDNRGQTCQQEEASCSYDYECCSKKCKRYGRYGGKCYSGFEMCVSANGVCRDHEDCCSRRCESQHYGPSKCYGDQTPGGSHNCKKEREHCNTDVDCCSKKCIHTKYSSSCQEGGFQSCVRNGDCISNKDCCSGDCFFPEHGRAYCRN